MNRRTRVPRLTAAAAALVCASAGAAEIETTNPDWAVRWDNTLKASSKVRTESASPALKNSFGAGGAPQALNFNSGDQNFQKKGIVSERLDVLSEFDAVWQKDFGLRISAATWYDQKLHQSSKADNDSTIGQSPYDRFPSYTRRISGGDADLLDAFVFGGWRLDNGMKATVRLGQHALQYGESVFFGDNGVARAQGPIDIDKLLASPNAQFKEVVRPVPQVSGQLQLSPTVSLGGYYQFKWEEDRLPPAGSYFSTANIPWGSSQTQLANISPTSYLLTAGADQKPKNTGQFGMQLKWRLDETDLGFYFARYHDKDGQLFAQLSTPPSASTPYAGGTWFYQFPEAIKVFGASASHSFGDFNFAAEGSIRNNMPLRSTQMYYGFYPGQPQTQIATGRTAHLNFSTLASFGPNFLSRESNVVAEIAWNRVLSKDDPQASLDAGRTRDASALQLIYTPTYRQVLPGLDLNVPVGLRYSLSGASSVTTWDARHNGSLNLGVEGNYLGVWQFTVTFTHYMGGAVPYVDYSQLAVGGPAIYGKGNSLADRDYVALSLRRTF